MEDEDYEEEEKSPKIESEHEKSVGELKSVESEIENEQQELEVKEDIGERKVDQVEESSDYEF